MKQRIAASVLLFAALMGFPGRVFAQSPTSPAGSSASEATKRAEELYQRGVRLYSEKKWAEAEAAFQKAWALNPTFDVAYNLGSAEYQLGKYRGAAEHLAFALRVWPLLGSLANLRPIAEQRLRESRAAVGALTVKVNVAQAEVFVDGAAVGKAPLAGEVFVTPGAHAVEAKLAGFEDAKQTIEAAKGTEQTVTLTLAAAKPKIEPVEQGNGTTTPPGQKDGVETGGPRKPLVIAGAVSSGALIAAGAVFAIVSSLKVGAAHDQKPVLFQAGGENACRGQTAFAAQCSELDNNLRQGETFADLSLWSFVAGVALGAGTAVYALATPSAKPAAAVKTVGAMQFLPVATPQGGGLLLKGAW